jgi:hypothetical protein
MTMPQPPLEPEDGVVAAAVAVPVEGTTGATGAFFL